MYLIFIFPFRFCQVISTFVSRLFLRSRCCCYCATRKKNGVGKKSRVHGDDRTNGDRRSTISRASDRVDVDRVLRRSVDVLRGRRSNAKFVPRMDSISAYVCPLPFLLLDHVSGLFCISGLLHEREKEKVGRRRLIIVFEKEKTSQQMRALPIPPPCS